MRKRLLHTVWQLAEFVRRTFAPGLHITFAVLWFLGLEGSFIFLKGGGRVWKLDGWSVLNTISVLLVLFFLRVVDEMKDYDYDKVYNPTRPLVCGIVTRKQLWIYLIITAVAVILLNAALSYCLVAVLTLDMIYAVGLLWLEKRSVRVRENMVLNLLVTYPVNIIISIYIYLSFLERYQAKHEFSYLLMICAVAAAFLNYEFGRKISVGKTVAKGRRLYSTELGSRGAIQLWVLCALFACCILLGVFQPWLKNGVIFGWLAVFVLIPVYSGVCLFYKAKKGYLTQGEEPFLTRYALQFFGLFYAVLVINVFIGNIVRLHF